MATDRRHRSPRQEAHGDHRRRDHGEPRSISSAARSRRTMPFFVWMNTTRMHVFTHVREVDDAARAACPEIEYADGMIEHDGDVGKLLEVVRRTRSRRQHDRGLHDRQRPESCSPGLTRRRRRSGSEKDSNWEGAFRVPGHGPLARHISSQATVSNEIFSGLDWFPTLLAAAGDATIKDRLPQGRRDRRSQDIQSPSGRLQRAARISRGSNPRASGTSLLISTMMAS